MQCCYMRSCLESHETNIGKTYGDKSRNLKTQNGFVQEVTHIKTKLEIKIKPQPLHQRRSAVDIEEAEHHQHLLQNIIKGETGTRRRLALETMNTRYPQDKWLHIFTDGSQTEGYTNAGAGNTVNSYLFIYLFIHFCSFDPREGYCLQDTEHVVINIHNTMWYN